MIDNTRKKLTILLLVFIVGTFAGIVGYLNAKITTFEECEKAGWLVRSITVYDGYGPIGKECVLWSGKSFVKEISQEQQRAVEIATAYLSYPVTIIEVKKLECQGCFSVKLQRDDNQRQFTIVLDNWEIKNVVQPDNISVLPAPFFPAQKEPAKSYMQALLSDQIGIIQIIDDKGQPLMRVGDKIKLGGGGGEMSGEIIAKYSADLPSDRCSGPYFIVGEVITVNNSTSPVATVPSLKSATMSTHIQTELYPALRVIILQSAGWVKNICF